MVMKPYSRLTACGRESCRLCNPVPVESRESEWPVFLVSAGIGFLVTVVVLFGFWPA